MHVEVILAVALIALARKVIAVNLKDYQEATIGLALLIAALAGSHWLCAGATETAREIPP